MDERESIDDLRRQPRRVYDRTVDARDRRAAPVWEDEQRDSFLRLLLDEKKRSLLEVGASTGVDALFFRSHGLQVACVDLSLAMAQRCREKGLSVYVMDASRLAFRPSSFDAVYARNCLVHVPGIELRPALEAIRRVLKPRAVGLEL